MRSPGRHWLAAAAAVPPLAAIAVLLVLGSDHEPHPVVQLVTGLFIGLSFSGSGLC